MLKEVLRVAAVQLSSQDNLDENLDACARAVESAAKAGAELVVLPENFAWFGDETVKRELAETMGDLDAPIQKGLATLSREHRLTLVGGGMPERSTDPARPYNTCIVLGPKGDLVASYRKLHLFDAVLPDGKAVFESECTSQGGTPQVFWMDGIGVGLSVCYDLRFPELYRRLLSEGASVLLVPAAFTLQTGRDHWHVLLRARAIESTAWVVAADQWGRHPRGRSCYGHSLIVDPWGTIVAECSDRVGFVVADLDLRYLADVRARLPSLAHRRLP